MYASSVLTEVRQLRGMTQQDVGDFLFKSKVDICKFEKGKSTLGRFETMQSLGPRLDDPWFYLAAIFELTGGPFATRKLDGDVDLHRAVVWRKTIEELTEAAESAEEAEVILIPPVAASDEQKQVVYDMLLQLIDARVALDHMLAVGCRDYGFSINQLFIDHDTKMETRKYRLKRKRPAVRASR